MGMKYINGRVGSCFGLSDDYLKNSSKIQSVPGIVVERFVVDVVDFVFAIDEFFVVY